jgi:pyruvate formate-lyase activating enzyme-like uncharacterized protein
MAAKKRTWQILAVKKSTTPPQDVDRLLEVARAIRREREGYLALYGHLRGLGGGAFDAIQKLATSLECGLDEVSEQVSQNGEACRSRLAGVLQTVRAAGGDVPAELTQAAQRTEEEEDWWGVASDGEVRP